MTLRQVEDKYLSEDEKGDWYFECDGKNCKQTLDAKDRTFKQAITFMKARRWKARLLYGGWRHYCPDCHT